MTGSSNKTKASSSGGEEKGKGESSNNPIEYRINLDGKWILGALAAMVAMGYMLTQNNAATNISWQEFRTKYLEHGEVERLEVIDHNVVRVYLRNDATMSQVTRSDLPINGNI